MSKQNIYEKLNKEFNNPLGVCGLMGNIRAESAFKSNNLQNSYEKALGYTDDSYVKAVDSGVRTRKQFSEDRAGFGLCQWTSSGRKYALYDYAKSIGKSIADEDMQIGFLIKELKTSYRACYDIIKNAKSVKEASDYILTKFERPKDQSETAKRTRASYGEQIYKELVSDQTAPSTNIEGAYYPIPNYTGKSIIEALNSIGVDSCLNNRKKIGAKNNIANVGKASANIEMLKLLKQGKLLKA